MTHNSKNRLYRIYCGMKQRCYNPNHINYNIYGKLGIHIYMRTGYGLLTILKPGQ